LVEIVVNVTDEKDVRDITLPLRIEECKNTPPYRQSATWDLKELVDPYGTIAVEGDTPYR
jgi:hypothetical protein